MHATLVPRRLLSTMMLNWTLSYVGRADYFGLAVNRAARFLGAACGGQVLAERGLVEEVVQYWHSLVYKYVLPHVLTASHALQLCPS